MLEVVRRRQLDLDMSEAALHRAACILDRRDRTQRVGIETRAGYRVCSSAVRARTQCCDGCEPRGVSGSKDDERGGGEGPEEDVGAGGSQDLVVDGHVLHALQGVDDAFTSPGGLRETQTPLSIAL